MCNKENLLSKNTIIYLKLSPMDSFMELFLQITLVFFCGIDVTDLINLLCHVLCIVCRSQCCL